ncbi:hypothetical protein YK48G_07750 [Lentilactobacillus fungorum]|uniref:Energy-coupling factor transporter transmembrane protein EcfT n=1 Tax=Lentilactobacillus fungorum TaxID=2201250 RepID=A0ABQ3VXS0_9LACO|nr:energy-coupling factor transporter transmembrane component T [Lentilactobacillus fungorum]GHP13350.1 hypothetical protein YK48G_07750 [Lentilactobacillus fungorum]
MKRVPLQMTFFSQVHPVASTIYFAELMTCLLLFNHVGVALTEVIGLTICGFYYLGKKSMIGQLKFAASFLIMILFFNTLLNQKFHPILWQFHWGFLTYKFSYAAFLYGLAMALILIAMLFVFALLNQILTPSRLIYVFSPIAPRLAMLVSISFTLVANFILRFKKLLILQRTRNLDTTSGSLMTRIKKILHLFEIMLQDSLSSAMETANLMDARGFGAAKRSHYRSYHWQVSDWIFIGLSSLLLLNMIIIRLLKFGWSRSVTNFTVAFRFADSLPIVFLLIFFLLPILSEGVYRACQN